MVDCAIRRKAGLVIVTRDADYGITADDKSYINDHLRQEFSERVSRKRSLVLYQRMSDALKLFRIQVSPQEEAAENELASDAFAKRIAGRSLTTAQVASFLNSVT